MFDGRYYAMVVEPDPHLRAELVELLELDEWGVMAFEDPTEALEYTADVLVVNRSLPNFFVEELITELSIPTVLLSRKDAEPIQCKVSEVLWIPFTAEDFLITVITRIPWCKKVAHDPGKGDEQPKGSS